MGMSTRHELPYGFISTDWKEERDGDSTNFQTPKD